MTRVQFYSNVTDENAALVFLLQKALVKKHFITIMVDSEDSAKTYSQRLWEQNRVGFIPNVLIGHTLAETTPVVISWQENQLCQDDILINLSHKQLTVFSRFRQLVELVGDDEQEKVKARQRYQFYRDRGYEVKHLNADSFIH